MPVTLQAPNVCTYMSIDGKNKSKDNILLGTSIYFAVIGTRSQSSQIQCYRSTIGIHACRACLGRET